MNLSEWHACSSDPEKYKEAVDLFKSRRVSNIIHVVHAAAAYLNPCLMYDKRVKVDQEDVKNGLLFIGAKMLDVEERKEFAEQLLAYDGRDPKIFHFLALTQMRSAHPRAWWEVNGGQILIVQKVAIRFLSQPCSAFVCERGWNGFEVAQTKKRSKLSPEMLDDPCLSG